MNIRNSLPGLALAAIAVAGVTAPAAADDVADFYKGKTITVIVAAGPGGGHTQYTQYLAPFLEKHMPGNPTFIVQNMGGAGGTKAENFLHSIARKDGTMIGILLSDTPLASRLRTTGVKYVAKDFQFLGGAEKRKMTRESASWQEMQAAAERMSIRRSGDHRQNAGSSRPEEIAAGEQISPGRIIPAGVIYVRHEPI
jgi:tripartite-type tricarboxylate transporter receptor subunit TctC